MEPLVSQPIAANPPTTSKKKYMIAGGVFALVLIGVVTYSLMSPAAVFKGTVFPNGRDLPVVPSMDKPAVPSQDPVLPVNPSVDYGQDSPNVAVTPNPDVNGLIDLNAKIDPKQVKADQLIADAQKALGEQNDGLVALNQDAAAVSPKPQTGNVFNQEPTCDGGRVYNAAKGACICTAPKVWSALTNMCMAPVANQAGGAVVQNNEAALNDASVNIQRPAGEQVEVPQANAPVDEAIAAEQNPVCNAAQHEYLVNGRCEYVVNDSENPALDPVAPVVDPVLPVKEPAGTVAAGSGLDVQIAGNLSAGRPALPGEVVTPGESLISNANAITPDPLKLLGDNAIPVNPPAASEDQGAAQPTTVINNYYSNGSSSSVDQATLDRIAALEAQIAAANAANQGGEVLQQADPKAVAKLQSELKNLQTKLNKSRANNNQVAATADPKTTQAVAKPAQSGNGLHGAAIRGESGPEVLLYPALVGLAQGGYMLLRKRRQK